MLIQIHTKTHGHTCMLIFACYMFNSSTVHYAYTHVYTGIYAHKTLVCSPRHRL